MVPYHCMREVEWRPEDSFTGYSTDAGHLRPSDSRVRGLGSSKGNVPDERAPVSILRIGEKDRFSERRLRRISDEQQVGVFCAAWT